MGKVLVISNRKVGYGKCFITVNLSVGLARQGKKVLCIDISAIKKSIFTHDPNGRVAAVYESLAKAVLEIA